MDNQWQKAKLNFNGVKQSNDGVNLTLRGKVMRIIKKILSSLFMVFIFVFAILFDDDDELDYKDT